MEQQMQRNLAAGYPANIEYPVPTEPAEAHTPKLENYANEPEPKGKSKSRQIRCSECPRVLMSRKNFIKHAEEEHGFHLPIIRKSFDNPEEFDRWIVFLRDHRNTEFISKCGRKRLPDSTLLGYMICSRSGGSVSKDAGMRKKTAKSGKTCSAYLKVLYQGTGKVDVEGCIDHTGHDLNADRIEASREERNYITNWLNEGVPFTEVVARLEARRTQNPEFTELKEENIMSAEPPASTDSPAPSTSARTESFTTTEHAETPEAPHDDHDQLEGNYMDSKRMKLGSESPKSDSNEPIVVVDEEDLPPRSQEGAASIGQPLSQQSLANPEAQLDSLPVGYVDVTLERRKLEMLESFQTALRRIEARTMDAAETALRFFLRELESLQKQSH